MRFAWRIPEAQGLGLSGNLLASAQFLSFGLRHSVVISPKCVRS